jgi:SAM-dependent methyltransferase
LADPFQGLLAETYDLVYRRKAYEAECDLIEQEIEAHGRRPTRSILDLGCGTGGHALVLAGRGYDVVGIEASRAMLARARQKASSAAQQPELYLADIKELQLGRRFDAALMMFAVLGYQLRNADVLAALRTARGHLRRGGLLLFDVWYGPAVLAEGPSRRRRRFQAGSRRITRTAIGELETRRHLCRVRFELRSVEGEDVRKAAEEHLVRYFFPLELELLLETTGFESIRIGAFPDVAREPDDSTWNVFVVSKAL